MLCTPLYFPLHLHNVAWTRCQKMGEKRSFSYSICQEQLLLGVEWLLPNGLYILSNESICENNLKIYSLQHWKHIGFLSVCVQVLSPFWASTTNNRRDQSRMQGCCWYSFYHLLMFCVLTQNHSCALSLDVKLDVSPPDVCRALHRLPFCKVDIWMTAEAITRTDILLRSHMTLWFSVSCGM